MRLTSDTNEDDIVSADQLRDKLRRLIEKNYDSIREFARENGVNHAQVISFLNGDAPDPAVLEAMGYEEVKSEKKYRKKK